MFRLWNFLLRGIWEIKTQDLSKTRAAGIRALRVPVLAVHDFLRDECWQRASALTYFTLLAIVPILAMVLGIAKGFGFESLIETELIKALGAQKQVVTHVLTFAKSMLENTKGGVVAGMWLILLFYTVIRMFGNIEEAFNKIWGIKSNRNRSRAIVDYLAAAILCTVFWLPASGISVLINHRMAALTKLPFMETIGPIILLAFSFLPWVMIWVLLSFLYIFLPNGNIRWRSGIVAGIVAGTAFQLFQVVYIGFQIGVAKNSAIYGSFAALPLFLIWLYFSWSIVLFGAEIAFAHQNSKDDDFGPRAEGASFFLKKTVALQVVHLVVNDFINGDTPKTEPQISTALSLPRTLVQEVLPLLEQAEILVETIPAKNGLPGFHPATDPTRITAQYVLDGLEKTGLNDLPGKSSPNLSVISQTLEAFSETIKKSPANKPLKDIAKS